MFQESLNIHYLGGSHIRTAVVGVQQKVHGVLITPCSLQLKSSQDKVHPGKFMHNGIQSTHRAAVALELHIAEVNRCLVFFSFK